MLLIFAFLSFLSIYLVYIHNGNVFIGDDMLFHRMRIEGLYEGILHYDFLPKINYSLLDGLGYASSTFYSDVFLYPAAILRLIGVPLTQAYVCLLLLSNFATFCTSFYSMHILHNSKRQSFLFSILYTLSTYRYVTLVARSALGETLAFIFIPLAFSGIISIVYKDSKKWYLLAIGMTGILLSNLLSAFMFSCLIVALLLFNIKPLLHKKENLLGLVKATFLSLGLSAFYFFPMLEQLKFQDLHVGNLPIFIVSDTSYSLVRFMVYTIINSPVFANFGLLYFLLAAITLCLYKNIKTKESKDFFWLTVLFLVLTTSLFPWGLLANTPLNSIQFPWRLFNIATLLVCWLVSLDEIKLLKSNFAYSIVIVLVLIFNIQMQKVMLNEEGNANISDVSSLTTWRIGGGWEYLPVSADKGHLIKLMRTASFPLYDKENGEILNYEKDYDKISFSYNLKEQTEITLPFLNYTGYVVEDNLTKDEFLPSLSSENNGLLSVKLDGQGEVTLKYKRTLVHVISNVISVLTLLVSVLIKLNRKN